MICTLAAPDVVSKREAPEHKLSGPQNPVRLAASTGRDDSTQTPLPCASPTDRSVRDVVSVASIRTKTPAGVGPTGCPMIPVPDKRLLREQSRGPDLQSLKGRAGGMVKDKFFEFCNLRSVAGRKAARRKLAKIHGTCCCWCGDQLSMHGIPGERPTIEHLVPRAYGGSDHIDNLRLCCVECNAERSTWYSMMLRPGRRKRQKIQSRRLGRKIPREHFLRFTGLVGRRKRN